MKTENLKKLREHCKMSQEEVAEVLGIARPSYSQIETGKRKLSFDEANSLADLFNVSLDDLAKGIANTPDYSRAYIEYLEDRVKNFYTGYGGTQLNQGAIIGNKGMCLLFDNRQALASALEQIKMYQSILNK